MVSISPPKSAKKRRESPTVTDRPAKPTEKKPIQIMVDKNLHTEFKQMALDEDCSMVELFIKMYEKYKRKR
ncbi:MAG: hypothetical protein LPD71_00010 [Shewanella sp.]|nr:hypothetical protein [Shewanella sp.]MCF1459501.1 hypothetical protein [Shewanella sp.]